MPQYHLALFPGGAAAEVALVDLEVGVLDTVEDGLLDCRCTAFLEDEKASAATETEAPASATRCRASSPAFSLIASSSHSAGKRAQKLVYESTLCWYTPEAPLPLHPGATAAEEGREEQTAHQRPARY